MRRKKAKYKHAVIGKKKYYFYKIVWNDPCGDAGHAEIEEIKIKSMCGHSQVMIVKLLYFLIVIVFQDQ